MKKLIILLYCVLFTFSCQQQVEKQVSENSLEEEITAIENNLLSSIQIEGESLTKFSLSDRMKHYNVPGLSIAVVKDGELRWAKGYGIANTKNGKPVDENTIFQAGSISKPLAALAALKLIQEGKLDLDTDVNTYLKDWQVEENKFTAEEKVTLRRLLTHTAGMTVHGFPGYQQTDEFPSVVQVLDGEGNTGRIFVDTFPDAIWRYSGGGYTVMEKVVEDISGMPLEEYMAKNIFPALGMTRSTYNQPLTEEYHDNASAAYNSEGDLYEGLWHNYPEQAAAGLWTTPTDLAKYCIAIQNIFQGKAESILSKEMVEKMLTKHKNGWGLGPSLGFEGDSLTFGHGGKNAGFTNDMRAFAHQGNAVIVMTSADRGGGLNREIFNSVSNYYNWGLQSPRMIQKAKLSEAQLNQMAGNYKSSIEVPGVGIYYVDITVKDDYLMIEDKIENATQKFIPLEELKFMDIETREQVDFKKDNEGKIIGFVYNGELPFEKFEEE